MLETTASRWLAALVWVLLVLAAPLDARAAAGAVQDIRIARHGDGTRVVIDLDRKVGFTHIALDNPPRLAIDLPDVAWRVSGGEWRQPNGLVGGLRFGRFRPGVSRIVIDVTQPFEIENVFELPPNASHGHRIVTDLVPARTNGAAGTNGTHAKAGGDGRQLAGLAVVQPPKAKPAPAPQKHLVVIDPGHGGKDPGAIGTTLRVREKDIALAIAQELRRRLEKTGRYRVVMTRAGDRTIRLRERLQIAHQSGGELFISLHADSLVKSPEVRGASVYTLSEKASSEEAKRLAQKENGADILAGIDLSDQEPIVTEILIDLAQRDARNKSIRVADDLVDELDEVTRMARRHRSQAGFVVLKSPDMPSVLIELGYLSNPADEKALRDPGHQAKLAQALLKAIDRYFAAGS